MPERCLVHWHHQVVHWHHGDRLSYSQRLSYCQRPAVAGGLCEYHQYYNGAPGACRCESPPADQAVDEAMAKITAAQLGHLLREV